MKPQIRAAVAIFAFSSPAYADYELGRTGIYLHEGGIVTAYVTEMSGEYAPLRQIRDRNSPPEILSISLTASYGNTIWATSFQYNTPDSLPQTLARRPDPTLPGCGYRITDIVGEDGADLRVEVVQITSNGDIASLAGGECQEQSDLFGGTYRRVWSPEDGPDMFQGELNTSAED
jgi:hypothetical protein